MSKLNQRGLTLIEMLVVIGISSIIALVVTQGFSDSLFVYNKERRQERIDTEQREILHRLIEEIREGTGLLANSTDGKTLGSNTLIVAVPQLDSAGQVRVVNDTALPTPKDELIVYKDGTDNLRFKVIPASGSFRVAIDDILLTDSLANGATALFSDSSTGSAPDTGTTSVRIRLIIEDTYRGETLETDNEVTITMKNYGN